MYGRHWFQKWKFDLKDLKLSKFSDMRTIDKTHNKFLAHEFEMRFKLFSFARRLFLMLLKKTKIYLYEKILFILLSVLSKYPNNLYLSKISWNEQISKIESRFKIVYFFWYTLRVNSKKGNPTLICYQRLLPMHLRNVYAIVSPVCNFPVLETVLATEFQTCVAPYLPSRDFNLNPMQMRIISGNTQTIALHATPEWH
jgi:hypothetical protein